MLSFTVSTIRVVIVEGKGGMMPTRGSLTYSRANRSMCSRCMTLFPKCYWDGRDMAVTTLPERASAWRLGRSR